MTLESIVKFKEICKKLNINISKDEDNFEKRVYIQDTFYLLNKLGVNLEVKYSFYKFGPYSPDLTDYYYAIMEYTDDEITEILDLELNKQEVSKVEKIQKMLYKWRTDSKFLEILVNLLFINKDMYIKNKDNEKIKETLKSLRSELFEEELYLKALNELVKEGLIEKE